MSLAMLVVTGVRLEHRTVSEVARDYDVSRQWIYTLLGRYDTEGSRAAPVPIRANTSLGRHRLGRGGSSQVRRCWQADVAEGGGFEPPRDVTPNTDSSRAP
jgi:hypothetical protein